MNKTNNYDTKSSILSIDFKDYKIPYEISQSSRIVQHLQESQQQLQFLKLKLTESYQKLETQIRFNMELSQNNQQLGAEIKMLKSNWQTEMQENKKLKQVMETMLKNRKMLQQQVQYTHKRYKKILLQKDQEFAQKIQKLQKQIKKLKKDNETLQDSMKQMSRREQTSSSKVNASRERKLQQKIQILENEIKKLTSEKVTQVTRLKHEIECYQQNSLSPLRTSMIQMSTTRQARPPRIQYFDAQTNNQNLNSNIIQSTIVQSKITTTDSKTDDDSISKWQKPKQNSSSSELTDDQKLTKAQMEKKKIENQLIKIQRLKRHTPEDRDAMVELQKKIYTLDSQISSLKRKIRQKY